MAKRNKKDDYVRFKITKEQKINLKKECLDEKCSLTDLFTPKVEQIDRKQKKKSK